MPVKILKSRRLTFYNALLFVVTACSQQNAQQLIPQPQLPDGEITLSVVHVINPRFKVLSPEQIEQVLSKTSTLVKQHFDVDVRFSVVDKMPIDEFFNIIPDKLITKAQRANIDVDKIGLVDRIKLIESIYATLKNYDDNPEAVFDYANPYLDEPYNARDLDGFSTVLLDTLIKHLGYWLKEQANDGGPVLNDQPYNQWAWWDLVGYGHLPYDVVITNQLVASIEDHAMDVHSALRGGISNGTTFYSKDAQFKTYVFASTFPMQNDSRLLTALRADESYTTEQITDYVAATLTHELGHQLFHFGHPFGESACIMSPTPLLLFRSWYDQLDPDQCRPGSSKQMTPGVAQIPYYTHW